MSKWNRLIYLVFVAIIISSKAKAFPSEGESLFPARAVEGRAGVFFPQSKRFRAIYGGPAPVYGVQLTKKLRSPWEFWTAFDWYSRSSRHSERCCHSSIKIPNFSYGARYLWSVSPTLNFYLGGGAILGIVFLNNHSCCSHYKESALALGGVIKGAAYWNLRPRIFVTLFANYSYQVAFFQKTINVGGTKVGGGLGWKF